MDILDIEKVNEQFQSIMRTGLFDAFEPLLRKIDQLERAHAISDEEATEIRQQFQTYRKEFDRDGSFTDPAHIQTIKSYMEETVTVIDALAFKFAKLNTVDRPPHKHRDARGLLGHAVEGDIHTLMRIRASLMGLPSDEKLNSLIEAAGFSPKDYSSKLASRRLKETIEEKVMLDQPPALLKILIALEEAHAIGSIENLDMDKEEIYTSKLGASWQQEALATIFRDMMAHRFERTKA